MSRLQMARDHVELHLGCARGEKSSERVIQPGAPIDAVATPGRTGHEAQGIEGCLDDRLAQRELRHRGTGVIVVRAVDAPGGAVRQQSRTLETAFYPSQPMRYRLMTQQRAVAIPSVVE